jgi:hypothetical protein
LDDGRDSLRGKVGTQCARTLLKFSGIQGSRYECKILYKYGDFVFLLLLSKYLRVERDEGVGRGGMTKKARGGRDRVTGD